MPQPRKILSRNYHHIAYFHPQIKIQEQLVEVRVVTILNLNDVESVGALRQQSGSFNCERFKVGGVCDACKHIQRETSMVESLYYKRRHAVHGHLVHLKPSQKVK